MLEDRKCPLGELASISIECCLDLERLVSLRFRDGMIQYIC